MSEPNQKFSKELAAALEQNVPVMRRMCSGWRKFLNGYVQYPNQTVYEVAELVLAQQREIEQLKAELKEVQRKLVNSERK